MPDEHEIAKEREIVRKSLEKFAREHPEEWAGWQAEAREAAERVVDAQAEAAADLVQCGYDWPSIEDACAIAQDLGMSFELVDAGEFTIGDLRKLARRFARAVRGAELRQEAIERLTKVLHEEEKTADLETARKPVGWMSARDLASEHSIPYGALRKRLTRWRIENGKGWMEVPPSERGPRDSRWLYQPDAVKDVIDEMKG